MYATDITKRRIRLHVVSFFLIWATLCVLGSEARAERKVYLNGIDLGDVDVRGHTFEGCTVRFDEQGNVHITVEGLQIGTTKEGGAGSEAPDGQAPTIRYYMVVKPVNQHGDRYQISAYVNGAMVRRFEGAPRMQVHDVTRYIKKGETNAIRLVVAEPTDKAADKRPSDDLEIVLGEGVIEKGMVVIQKPHVQYRQKKDDTRARDEKYTFKAHR